MMFQHLIPLGLNIVWALSFSLFVLLIYLRRKKKLKRVVDPAHSAYYDHLRRSTTWTFIRHMAIIVMVFIIGLTPQTPHEDSQKTSSAEVFFFVDRTGSMGALDYAGKGLDYGGQEADVSGKQPRINGVRRDMNELLHNLGPVRISIITSESNGIQVLPLTSDINSGLSWINYATVETADESMGSSLARSFSTLKEALDHAKKQHPEANRVLFVFTDGEDTADRGDHADWASIKGDITTGQAFFYGTAAGAKMPADTAQTGLSSTSTPKGGYLEDPDTGKPGISHADESAVKELAAQADLSFHNRNKGGSLNVLIDSLKSGQHGNVLKDKPVVVYRALMWPWVTIVMFLACFELAAFTRNFRDLRRARVFEK